MKRLHALTLLNPTSSESSCADRCSDHTLNCILCAEQARWTLTCQVASTWRRVSCSTDRLRVAGSNTAQG